MFFLMFSHTYAATKQTRNTMTKNKTKTKEKQTHKTKNDKTVTFTFIFLVGVATVVTDAFWDLPDDEDAKDLNFVIFFGFAG